MQEAYKTSLIIITILLFLIIPVSVKAGFFDNLTFDNLLANISKSLFSLTHDTYSLILNQENSALSLPAAPKEPLSAIQLLETHSNLIQVSEWTGGWDSVLKTVAGGEIILGTDFNLQPDHGYLFKIAPQTTVAIDYEGEALTSPREYSFVSGLNLIGLAGIDNLYADTDTDTMNNPNNLMNPVYNIDQVANNPHDISKQDIVGEDGTISRMIIDNTQAYYIKSAFAQNVTIPAKAEVVCTDSDGGKDYYVKGYTFYTVDGITRNDFCWGDLGFIEKENILQENYCKDNIPQAVDYNCPNGCQDGACVIPGVELVCSDSTPYGQCSTNQPKYCDNGNLTNKASVCGCPGGMVKDGEDCIEEVICSCADWTGQGCAQGGCAQNEKWFTRECAPDKCDIESECRVDAVCEDCDQQDGWYATGDTQWLNIEKEQCKEKEQKEQEQRDYFWQGKGCEYNVVSSQWIDTGNTRNKSDGANCNDALWCTVSDSCAGGMCSGTPRNCLDGNECTQDSCNEDQGECDNQSYCQDTDTDCGCQSCENCDLQDDWYDTENVQWIDVEGEICKEKKQKEQEYKDYFCDQTNCNFKATNTQWADTNETRDKPGCTPFPVGENSKNLNKYSNKEVFLISDTNWQDVLPLVPVAVWTENSREIKKWPMLIYHEEREIDIININVVETLDIYPLFVENIKATLEGPILSVGESGEFLISFTNLANITQSFPVQIVPAKYFYFSLSSDEIKVVGDFLMPIGGNAFTLLPQETQSYHINITVDKAPGPAGGGYDADSILWFLEQYKAQKVTAIGNLPEELVGLINGRGLTPIIISPDNYLDYWSSFDTLVYVQDNYELSLMASTYASLHNAPLIIQNSSFDKPELFKDRKVIGVGACPAGITCQAQYTLEQLQKQYVQETNTDKIILVNPNDLDIKVTEEFTPEKSSGTITELYSQTSLAASILASAKHEVIITKEFEVIGDSFEKSQLNDLVLSIDNFIDNKFQEFNINEGYLTIMGTPDAIENRFYYNLESSNIYNADVGKYATLDEDAILELAVGRIYGISISDVSSYVSRAIFNDKIKSGEKIFLATADFPTYTAETLGYLEVYPNYGYDIESVIEYVKHEPSLTSANFENKLLVQYRDHAGRQSLGLFNSMDLPYLDNTFFLATSACSTCLFHEFKKPSLFCMQALRKGSLGYTGFVTSGGGNENYQHAISAFSQRLPIGDVWKENSISNLIPFYSEDGFKSAFGLLGDPTVKLDFTSEFPESKLIKVSNQDYIVDLKIVKIPFDVVFKGENFNDYAYISSPSTRDYNLFITNMRVLNYPFVYPPEMTLRGFIKLGPFQRNLYNTVEFEDPDINGKIFEREVIDDVEYLWIFFEADRYFDYNIMESEGIFQTYEMKFSIS